MDSIISEYITILLNKYKLNYSYNKYRISNFLLAICNQIIYWSIVICSMWIVKNPQNTLKYITYIFIILLIELILNRYMELFRSELTVALVSANIDYFTNNLINLSENDLLNIDMHKYNTDIYDANKCICHYIKNFKDKYIIPFTYLRFLIIAYKINYPILIILGIIICMYIWGMYDYKHKRLHIFIDNIRKGEHKIKNYINNSRNNIINRNINIEYINTKKLDLIHIENNKCNMITATELYLNIGNILFIFIIIYFNLNKINKDTFYFYLMIIYEIINTNSNVKNYYRNADVYSTLPNILKHLFKYKATHSQLNIVDSKISQIIIKKLNNEQPKLILDKQIVINYNDHILVDGATGMGKTSLLYILASINKVDNIDITPSLEILNNHIYITLPNYKNIYNGNLYDIITNYTSANIDLIRESIKLSKLNIIDNIYININKISAGQIVRLIIAQLIYTIKTHDRFSILFFDEIDQNLNDDLAYEICQNIRDIFSDKIILYITHNNIVKKLFNKKILVNNGYITI
jgi:ABC-type lipoprotein export system ATPase subunit